MKSLSRVQLFATPWTIPTRLLGPWHFLGKSTGVGCHFLLQGIFPTQGSNPGFPHCKQTLYRLSHQEALKRHRQLKNIHNSQIYISNLDIFLMSSRYFISLHTLLPFGCLNILHAKPNFTFCRCALPEVGLISMMSGNPPF